MMEIYLLRCVSLLLARCVIGRVAAIRPQLEHKPTYRRSAGPPHSRGHFRDTKSVVTD